jgi:hypothetical protein
MAGSWSDAVEKKILDHYFGATALAAPPGTLYLALLTDSNTDPQRDAGTVTEVATANWTNYQRAPVTNNTTNFPNSTGVLATKSNANDIGPAAFLSSGTTATIPTGTVVINAAAWYDAASAGNLIGWFRLEVAGVASPKTLSQGDTFKIPASSFVGTQD